MNFDVWVQLAESGGGVKNIVTCKGGWREGKRSKREGMK